MASCWLVRFIVGGFLISTLLSDLSQARSAFRCWSNLNAGRFKSDNFQPCFENKCRCDGFNIDCSSNFGQLPYVPLVKGGGEVLNFSNNNVVEINDPHFFVNVSRSVLAIDLYNNGLTRLTSGVFRFVFKLKRVLIGGNKLKYDQMDPVLQVSRLRSLEIKCGGLGDIPKGFFFNRPCFMLRYIDMSWNKMQVLHFEAFQPLRRLENLRLSNNRIQTVNSSRLQSLKYLILHKNKIVEFPMTCDENGESLFPNLILLDLDFNHIDALTDSLCLPSLTNLSLKYNYFDSFTKNMFLLPRFPKLQQVELTQMRVKILEMEAFAFNNSQLTYIKLGYNSIDFSSEIVHEDVFRGCHRLENLYMDRTNFNAVSDERFRDLFGSLTSLKVLYLGYTGLQISPTTFLALPNLQELYMYSNSLRSIPDGGFDHLVNLTTLKLGNNQIATVPASAFGEDTRRRLSKLDLSGNPFYCSCDITLLRDWMTARPHLFSDYRQAGYRCANLKNTTVAEYYIAKQACLLDRSTNILIIGFSVIFIVFLLAVMVIYSWRWHLRLWFYDFRHGNPAAHRRKGPFEYDVFVVYDSDDREWVHRQLRPTLEERWGLRLCIHERDFTLGRYIVENIVENMDKSYSILVVLSSNLASSDWCELELNLAIASHALLLPVLLPGLQEAEITHSMRALLCAKTYVAWSEQRDARESFWKLLHAALGTVLKKRR